MFTGISTCDIVDKLQSKHSSTTSWSPSITFKVLRFILQSIRIIHLYCLRALRCLCRVAVTMRPFALTASLAALCSAAPYGQQTPLKNILENTDKSEKYTYPTDFTREIIPKPFHSHNDYWRDVPFYSGLSQGAISTEADVWLLNGTLYVSNFDPYTLR